MYDSWRNSAGHVYGGGPGGVLPGVFSLLNIDEQARIQDFLRGGVTARGDR